MVPKEAGSESGFAFISGNARTAANQGRIRKHSQRKSRIHGGLPTSTIGLYGSTFPIQGRGRSQRYEEGEKDEDEDRASERHGFVPLVTQHPPSEKPSTHGMPFGEERAPSPAHDLVKYSRDPFAALPFQVDDLDFQLFYDFCNCRHTDFRVHPSLAQVYDWDLDKRLFTSGANAFSALFLSSSHYAASSGGLLTTEKIKSHEARTAHFLSAQSDSRPQSQPKRAVPGASNVGGDFRALRRTYESASGCPCDQTTDPQQRSYSSRRLGRRTACSAPKLPNPSPFLAVVERGASRSADFEA